MKRTAFFHLVAGTVFGLLFSLGLCMCLLPQWNLFRIGLICTAIGTLGLLIQGCIAWISSGRKIRIQWKLVGKLLYGIFAALVLGTGMCMILVWNLVLPGILVGILGIVLLLLLIPMCIGLK